MKYMYHVQIFTTDDDGQDNWSRVTSRKTQPYTMQTLEDWLDTVTNYYEGAEVISITETGDRLTAIVRTEDHDGDDDDDDDEG